MAPASPRLDAAFWYVVRRRSSATTENGTLLCWGRTMGACNYGDQAGRVITRWHQPKVLSAAAAARLLRTSACWCLYDKEGPPQQAHHQQKRPTDTGAKDIDILRERPFKDLPFGEKVKQTGKDASYLAIIVAGFGVTGMMFYVIGRELLSSESPNGVYSNAIKKCQNNYEVTDALGTPIKAYGELTRRGRRQHPSYMEFTVAGRQAMRMKFYLEGASRHATVHLEVRKSDRGRYEYEYLIVELDDGYGGGRQIVVERAQQPERTAGGALPPISAPGF